MKTEKLINLFSIIKGKKVDPLETYVPGAIRYIQIEDLRNDNNIKWCLPNEKYVMCTKDDIIIAWDGAYAGTVGFNLEGIIGSTLAVLRPKKRINSKLVGLYLQSQFEYIHSQCTGATIPHVNRKSLEQMDIPVFDESKENKILDLLYKSNQIIKFRKQQLKKLDELIQSVFYEMFGNIAGEKYYLKDLIIINPSKNEISNLDENTLISFVGMADVSENGEINTNNTKQVGEVYKGYTYFAENDVLFAKITPCMENGKGCIARNLVNGIGFGSTEFYVLRPKPNVKLTSEFLFYLTHSKKFRTLAEKNMTGSAGQKRVPKHFIENFKIVLPPQELQHKFTAIVERIEKKKELMKQSLKLMEDNFNSLMQRAFRGELV